METKAIPLNSPVFLVMRYHNIPQAFLTYEEAEEFAMNCGDYIEIVRPIKKG